MRSATVFLALAATLASAADSKKSPLEEFSITLGNVDQSELGELKYPGPLLTPSHPGFGVCAVRQGEY